MSDEQATITIADDILASSYFKNSSIFQGKKKETQIQYYSRRGSTPEIMELVELTPKPFGAICERLIIELFKLGPRTSSQNDASFNGKNIEIKSARYWGGMDDCVWQHLEPDHDYEYALFVLIGFDRLNVWGIKKSLLMGELREKEIVTNQGAQGWWTKKSRIISYLEPIRTIADLTAFIA